MWNLFEEPSSEFAKMYSTYTHVKSEKCFAFTLLPYSQYQSQLGLKSIQFDFNHEGEILELSIHFQGKEGLVQQNKQEIQAALIKLKTFYKKSLDPCEFDSSNARLFMQFTSFGHIRAYFSDIINYLEKYFNINRNFIKEMKEQLLDTEYLAEEHTRLLGQQPHEKPSGCILN